MTATALSTCSLLAALSKTATLHSSIAPIRSVGKNRSPLEAVVTKTNNVLNVEIRTPENDKTARDQLEEAAWNLVDKFAQMGVSNTRFHSTSRNRYSLQFTANKENALDALSDVLSISESAQQTASYEALNSGLTVSSSRP